MLILALGNAIHHDSAALAAAMETALSKKPDRAALKRRAQFFSVERAVAEYERVLFRH